MSDIKKVYLIGIGMGNTELLSLKAKALIQNSNLIIGAKRVVESVKFLLKDDTEIFECYDSKKIVEKINSRSSIYDSQFSVVCVFSGDTGFYSGAKKLADELEAKDWICEFIPGITSAQYMAAKFGENWQDWNLVSAHGTECNFEAEIAHNKKTFFLTGGKITVKTILEFLMNNEIPCQVCIGNRMSYEDETLTSFYMNVETHNLTDELKKIMTERNRVFLEDSVQFDLACVLVENLAFDSVPHFVGALPDEVFERNLEKDGKKTVPLTKFAVRSAILSLIAPKNGDVIWDIGAGSGGVSVDLARSCKCRVFGIEEKENAFELEKINRKKFGAFNLTLIHGKAPDILETLPIPDSVFVGGSEGFLKEIVEFVLNKNPYVKILVSAVTMETVSSCYSVSKTHSLALESTQLSVSNSMNLGQYHIMKAENPVWLFLMRKID